MSSMLYPKMLGFRENPNLIWMRTGGPFQDTSNWSIVSYPIVSGNLNFRKPIASNFRKPIGKPPWNLQFQETSQFQETPIYIIYAHTHHVSYRCFSAPPHHRPSHCARSAAVTEEPAVRRRSAWQPLLFGSKNHGNQWLYSYIIYIYIHIRINISIYIYI